MPALAGPAQQEPATSTPNPDRRRGPRDRMPFQLSVPVGVALPVALPSLILFAVAYLPGRYSTDRQPDARCYR
jgi:hypothetical protein